MGTKAKDLRPSDEFTLETACMVLAVETVAGGKRVKVRVALLDSPSVKFAGDDDIVVEFLCRPSRPFQVWGVWLEEHNKSLEEWLTEHAADGADDGAAC